MKSLRYSTLIRIAVYGGLVVFAASIWAWALGFAAWHGAGAGASLGLALGVLVDKFMEEIGDADDLTGLLGLVAGTFITLLLLALSIVGAIVGIVLQVFLT